MDYNPEVIHEDAIKDIQLWIEKKEAEVRPIFMGAVLTEDQLKVLHHFADRVGRPNKSIEIIQTGRDKFQTQIFLF